MQNKLWGNVLSSFAYAYYLDGNQSQKTTHTGVVTSYTYDSLGRLQVEAETGGDTVTYTFDRFGNRDTMTVAGVTPSTTAYSYDQNNRLTEEVKTSGQTTETFFYRYDPNGNQICREWQKVAPKSSDNPGRVGFVTGDFHNHVATLEMRKYNGYNRLVEIYSDLFTARYQYRPDGLRFKKVVNNVTTTHVWDVANIVMELGDATNRYIRGIGLIMSENHGYYLFNAHGDVIQLVNANGGITKNYTYDAFGNEKNPDSNDTNVFRYCGEMYDSETREYYLRARYYNPVNGRFTSEDIARDGLNWYTYCGNNPIAFVDPWGLAPIEIYEFINELIEAGEIKGYEYSWILEGDQYTVTINGITLTYDGSGKNKHDMNIWVENGKLMAEDYDIAYFFKSTGWVQYFPGFEWNVDGQLFKVDTHAYFLSKQFSKDFANEVMSLRQTDFWGGLTAKDIAAECYAHAVMLVYSSELKRFWDRADSWYTSAEAIDIAANDPRKPRFDALWTLVGKNTSNPVANRNIFKNNK